MAKSSPIKPLGDRVVAVREKAPEKTASGLYLPDSSKEKPVLAEILAVGPDVTAVKVGQKILYKEFSTTEIKIDGVEYLIVKQEDILGTI
ncbi:molecular chaperone GroES [Candidatus Saccharibacteria bacterium]|nr:MAG: molecular chaperone GroES [Candidatus Saccharibacteria bacterium]